MKIALHEVTRRFGAFTALDTANLDIHSGELVALLGPSGSGKTTLLRIIAGLDWPDQGEVHFDGEDALSRSVGERNVGFVFQNYALFRHMPVVENVAFGLGGRPRRLRPTEAAIRARVNQLLELVQLSPLGQRLPNQLSGGQRQRIALAPGPGAWGPAAPPPATPAFCCSTSRSARSTPRCARSCGAGFVSCTRRSMS